MKRGVARWLASASGIIALGTALPALASNAAHRSDEQRLQRATTFLERIEAGQFDDAIAMTTPAVAESLGNGQLETIWKTLPKQVGARTSRSAARIDTVNGRSVVSSRLTFALAALDARVVFDANNVIAGFWLVPIIDPAPMAAPFRPADAQGTAIDVHVGDAADGLAGTLTLPKASPPFAAVVLVHGSGVHDRDETIGPNKPFLDLAEGLATRGIAVLRYEKRTRAHPERFAKGDYTVDDETVDDAVAAIALLRARNDIDARRLFVAGHSLGAMMAPRIGERDPRIAGLILLAAPAGRLEDIAVRQSRYLARLEGRTDAQIDAAMPALERQRETIRRLPPSGAVTTPLMLNLPASYWRDLNGYDPIASARRIVQPLLILQGARDYQVTPADDFTRWRAAFAGDARITLIDYPLLGHAFMPGNDPPGPKDYAVPAHVDAKVIDDIAAWIRARDTRALDRTP